MMPSELASKLSWAHPWHFDEIIPQVNPLLGWIGLNLAVAALKTGSICLTLIRPHAMVHMPPDLSLQLSHLILGQSTHLSASMKLSNNPSCLLNISRDVHAAEHATDALALHNI